MLYLLFALLILCFSPLQAYRLRTAEQYYQIYHEHLYQYPEDTITNINYLLAARDAPFNNPLHALTPIQTQEQWLYYQQLFRAYINLELVRQQLHLASQFDKFNAFFYNMPWRKQNLDTLENAAKAYRSALAFWKTAQAHCLAIEQPSYQLDDLEMLRHWQTVVSEVQNGTLNYEKIINRQLIRIEQVRATFSEE